MADILYLSKLHRCFFTCCCNNNEQKWGCIDHERVIFIQHALQCWLSTNYFVTKVMKMARIWKSKVFVSSLQRNFSDKSFSVVQESFLSTSTPQSWKKYKSIFLLFPNFFICWLVSWFYIFFSSLFRIVIFVLFAATIPSSSPQTLGMTWSIWLHAESSLHNVLQNVTFSLIHLGLLIRCSCSSWHSLS